jgi:hypothetical protein
MSQLTMCVDTRGTVTRLRGHSQALLKKRDTVVVPPSSGMNNRAAQRDKRLPLQCAISAARSFYDGLANSL